MSIRNNRRPNLAMAGLAAAVLAGSNVLCAQIPCAYEVTAIIQAPDCPPFGFPPTLPRGVNDVGCVVGNINSCVIGPDVAFLWTPEGGLEILDMPPDTTQSRAIDINNHPDRQIVGTVDISGLGTRAFLIDGEDLIIIPPPGGGTFSSVAALNNQRQVVGSTADATPYSKAYIWEDGVMTIIEPTFGRRSAARAINEAGVVVGWMGTSTGTDSHAFVWQEGRVIDIGLPPKSFAAVINAISGDGASIVSARLADDDPSDRLTATFLWQFGEFLDLGTLAGFDVVFGFDLNDDHTVVGMLRAVNSSEQPDTAFIWQLGLMRKLNDLIPPESQLQIQRAEGINGNGQIAVRAVNADNDVVAVLLTPVEGPLGDLNADCQVGVVDLLILLGNWGACDNCRNCPADLDNNCVVGVKDLLTLLGNWG